MKEHSADELIKKFENVIQNGIVFDGYKVHVSIENDVHDIVWQNIEYQNSSEKYFLEKYDRQKLYITECYLDINLKLQKRMLPEKNN